MTAGITGNSVNLYRDSFDGFQFEELVENQLADKLQMLFSTLSIQEEGYVAELEFKLAKDPEFHKQVQSFLSAVLEHADYQGVDEVTQFTLADKILTYVERSSVDDCFQGIFKNVLDTHPNDPFLVLLEMGVQTELMNFDRNDVRGLANLIVMGNYYCGLVQDRTERNLSQLTYDIEEGIEIIAGNLTGEESEEEAALLGQYEIDLADDDDALLHELLIAQTSWLLALKENASDHWNAAETISKFMPGLTEDTFLDVSRFLLDSNAASQPNRA